jgi:carnitine O-octanoyltransferase
MVESLAEKLFVLPAGDSEHTFEHDETLPSLPVPSLHHTLDRYLDSVKPFVNEEEFMNTARLVSEFENGDGQKLQAKLMQRAKNERNWVSQCSVGV